MRVSSMLPAIAAVSIAAGALAQQPPPSPPPLTEAEALGLIELTPEEIAARLEARVNEGLPQETDLDEATAAFEAYVAEAMERVREERGAVATQFEFDTAPDPLAAYAARIDLTPVEYERVVEAVVAALTSPEALRLVDRMAASAPTRTALDADDPFRWFELPDRPSKFADGSVHLAWLLSRAAREAASAGDGPTAVAHLRRLMKLAGVIHGRPSGMYDALRYRHWTSGLVAEDGVRPVIASGALDAEGCREVRDVLESVDCLDVGRAAADAEMFIHAGMMRKILTDDDTTSDEAVRTDWRLFVKHWASLRPAYVTPIGEGDHWAKAVAIGETLEETGRDIASIGASTRLRVAFGAQVDQLQVEASVIMLALEEHRLDHGAHPEALDDLVPQYLDAVPIDPLTGESFRYVREVEGEAAPTTGYTLYSIGSDMHDDGGAIDPDFDRAGLSFDTRVSEPYDHIFNRPDPLADPGADDPQ